MLELLHFVYLYNVGFVVLSDNYSNDKEEITDRGATPSQTRAAQFA